MDRTQFQSIATCAMAAALLSSPAEPQSAPQTVTAWTNGRWFNGTMFTPLDVYSVGPRLTLKRPRRIDRTVDLANTYVTPAFGEAHNHNLPGVDADAMIRTYLSQGIFYVMIQENSPDARAQLAHRINRPTSVDVAFANGAFTSPGGHPSGLVERNIKNGGMTDADRDGGFLLPVSSTDNIDRQWWTRVRRQRPDLIKMMLVYSEDRATGVPRPTDTDRHGLDPTLAAHIVTLARREKLRVSAHVESAYDFDVAVAAGADIIAHMPGFWPDLPRISSQGIGIYKITDEAAARAGRQHTIVVTTISESLRYMATDQIPVAIRESLRDVYRHNLATLAKHGVRIAIGSDQFRSTSVEEALEIHRAGLMTPAALLRALSSDAAGAVFPRRAPFGLAEGAPADFLVFDENVLQSFDAIQRVRRRVKGGEELP